MSAALKLNTEEEKLSQKPPLGEKRPRPRLVWVNPKLSDGSQKAKSKAKPGASYGRVLYNYFRTYDPTTGRYITADPIGLEGGLNTYTYVGGNPLRWVDPFGLYTEITIWQPYGLGGSSFGHVSGNINGKNYSFTPRGWDSRYPTADAYIQRQQQFRSGAGVVLNLTPDQEAQFAECLNKSNSGYDAITDNCGTPFKDCLSMIGQSIGYPLFPADIGDALLNSPLYDGSTFYPGPSRGLFENLRRGDLPDAPWAR